MAKRPLFNIKGKDGLPGKDGQDASPGFSLDSNGKIPDNVIPYRLSPDQLDATIGAGAESPQARIGMGVARAQIMPYLTPLMERAEPLRIVMVQDPDLTVYATWSRTGEVPRFEKSTDGGLTWTVLAAALPAVPKVIRKLASGTLLLIEETATTTPGGSNPRMWRSADDGSTWSLVSAGLKFPPISAQGVAEAGDGSVVVAEYGNIGTFGYSIRRSTDDGLTWTAVLTTAGTEPQGDPGHFHSVTWDPIAGRLVAFSDRPIIEGVSGPRIYSSTNGATWTLIGEATGAYTPNFVSPMYFENYIAWGSDNQINGLVGRIRREDFYAGEFDRMQIVAQLDQKAAYFTFPVRPGVWLMSQNVEHIKSSAQDGVIGSYASPVYVIDEDGARVSGGIESYYGSPSMGVGKNPGVRASFPSYRAFDHNGFAWVNMPVGTPRAYQATPVSQGWAPPRTTITAVGAPRVAAGAPVRVAPWGGGEDVRLIESLNGYIAMMYSTAPTGRAEVRYLPDGSIAFYSGGAQRASVPAGGGYFVAAGRFDIASNQVGIRAGGGSPEGVVVAPAGTVYLNWAGGTGETFWIKESGSGNIGWVPVSRTTTATSANLGQASHAINARGKYEGRPAYDSVADRPVWAAGPAATDPWKYADGTTAFTPS